MVAGVRRHDSAWQLGSGSRSAFRWHIFRARVRRNYLRRVSACYVVRDSAARGVECKMICRAGASPGSNPASGALALQLFNKSPSTIRLSPDLAVNDVQCPLVDIERCFFDGFAQGGVSMSGAPDVFGAAAEFDY